MKMVGRIGVHTIGFLAKLYVEEMEHVSTEPIDALTATGAAKPQVLHGFIAYNLYILDRNVRMATMLGIVGAGGHWVRTHLCLQNVPVSESNYHYHYHFRDHTYY